MEFLLVGLFELVVVVFYIFVSSVLLSHGLVGRWVNFSVGFFVVYLLVSFFLFGRIPVPAPVLQHLNALLVLGPLPCLGYCMYRRFSVGETLGVLAGYLFFFLVVVLLKSEPVPLQSVAGIHRMFGWGYAC